MTSWRRHFLNRIIFCLLALLLSDVAEQKLAWAKDVQLFTKPDEFWVGAKGRVDPAQGGLVMFGPTNPSASWYIAEFNNPGSELPPFTRKQVGSRVLYTSQADAASAEVEKSQSGAAVTIRQDNSIMPCHLANGGPGETDLLLGMNHPWVNHLKPDATSADPKPGVYDRLSNMTALNQRLTVTAVSEWQPYPKARCEANQGNLMVALTLRDDAVTPAQVMYYELALRTICHDGPTYQACLGRQRRSGFYWTGASVVGAAGHQMRNFGYRDTLATLGQPMIGPNETRILSFDYLPILTTLFGSGQHGLDSDLTHWRVMSGYLGQNIWGNVGLSSRWSGYELTAAVK